MLSVCVEPAARDLQRCAAPAAARIWEAIHNYGAPCTEDGDLFQLPLSGQEYTLRVEIADPDVSAYAAESDHGHFAGLAVGETTAAIQVYHGSHPDWQFNPPLPIDVVDHSH